MAVNIKDFKLENFEFNKSMYIEASAGTGKTFTIKEIVKKLVEHKIPLEKILVVTYTEKAVGELRDRIREAVSKIGNCDADVDNAPIFTIHSFCQKTLSEFAFTANQPSELSLVNETEISEFIDRWIRDKLKDDDTFRELFEYDNKSSFIESLKNDFQTAVQKYYLDKDENETEKIVTLDDFYIHFDANKKEPAKDYTYQECDKLIETAETDYMSVRTQYKRVFSEKDCKNNKKVLHAYKKCRFYRNQLKRVYTEWQQEKANNKLQSYDNMLRNVREAVCDETLNLKEKLQQKYTYAIIDEFQDTNQRQWDIFSKIFMEDKNHTIIVVGDPKQSIYAFQGADVNVYNKAIQEIEEKGGTGYSLRTNWRSTDEMIDACNQLFSKAFFDPNSGITFTGSNPSGSKKTAQYCGKNIAPFWIAGTPDNRVSESDFARIAVQQIVDACKYENGKTKLQIFKKGDESKTQLQNVSFRDFAVLARSASEMEEIERAMRYAGIPFARYKDKNLFAGLECMHWISLLNAIASDDFTGRNRTILSEALFTEFFNIPLEKVEEERYDSPSNPIRGKIISWHILAQKRQWAKLIEKIFADTDIENSLSSLDKIQSLSKFRQIGNYAAEYLYENDCSLEDLSKHLSRIHASSAGAEDDGNLVAKGTDFDCVQVMTIHASKGLEFPVVIVAGGFKQRNNKIAHAYLYHDQNRNAKLSFSEYGKERMQKEDDYEFQRLFYVAYTRASSLLIIPLYEKWISKNGKDSFYNFLVNSFSSFITYHDESFMKSKMNSDKLFWLLEDSKASYNELKKDVHDILDHNQHSLYTDDSKTPGNTLSKELAKKIPSLMIRKYSYTSLAEKNKKPGENQDFVAENSGRNDKEDDDNAFLVDFDKSENPVTISYNPSLLAASAPKDFPKGVKPGIALHEIFEKADFTMAGNFGNVEKLKNNPLIMSSISECLGKQIIPTSEKQRTTWLEYTSEIFWNTLNASFPEIIGNQQTENNFALREIENDCKIAEAEFNLNPDVCSGKNFGKPEKDVYQIMKKYCNGFVDLVFKRTVNGKDIYSIVDWKSNSFERSEYASKNCLKNVTDEKYSIQRVLYSYCLVKWLSLFYKDETEEQVFLNHFGGIYYVYIRGCVKDTANGIYARTWNTWKDLEDAFNKIFENLEN
ncbi:MAG: UvrD-helicase domain-containing protein [Treponemataceae bacterium]|nr:UvrD-helicase domain-containing protein [Treponemataceae bacterium]